MDNSTNTTNATRYSGRPQENVNAAILALTCQFLFCIIGALINSWLFACLVKSKELRSKTRNQVICNICLLHLTEIFLTGPLDIYWLLAWLHRIRINYDHFCYIYSTQNIVDHVHTCVEDWLVLILAALFLAHVLDFDLSSNMTPRTLKIATAALHASPWIFAAVATLAAYLDVGIIHAGCAYLRLSHTFTLMVAYTAVPVGLAAVVILTACVLRWVRFRRGSLTAHGHMGVQLLGRGPEVDNVFAYLLAVSTVVLSETLYLVLLQDIVQRRFQRGMSFWAAAHILQSSRVVLMQLVWLLLPDIRARLKVWRPWRAEASGIDLAVSYRAEEGTVKDPHYSG